jgi:hypothetical protein
VTASPLPIPAFLLARALPLVLQVKQLHQLHAIAPAHQPHEGDLGVIPLLLVPPPISGSGAGGLDRWWGRGLTLGTRAALGEPKLFLADPGVVAPASAARLRRLAACLLELPG